MPMRGMGYGMWAADTTTVNPTTGVCVLCVTQVQGGKGYLGVVGAGYDWQFAPTWVAGVFGDFDISSLKGTIQDQDPRFAGSIKQTSAWAVGPRVGWLPSPQTMTYVNGGYTGARFSGTNMVFDLWCPIRLTTPAIHRQRLVRGRRRGNDVRLVRHARQRLVLAQRVPLCQLRQQDGLRILATGAPWTASPSSRRFRPSRLRSSSSSTERDRAQLS